MNDKRHSPRQRVLKAGTISFGLGAGISCTVRNLSERGASLEIASPIGIPNEFTLVIITDNVKRLCRVAWRSARRIGISFV
jgi:hypothetical protein